MNTTQRQAYGKALSEMGFTYHNVIRYRRNNGYDLINDKQLDWFMNNLVKNPEIDRVWACIEPDIDKATGYVYKSNHVHFAYTGKELTNHQLSKWMRINRAYLLNSEPLEGSMSYFTKHLGKSLSHHNIYL